MKVFGWFAILVWAAFLYSGVKLSTHSALLCSTALDFPQNHMLAAGDFTCATSAVTKMYEGRYLKHASTKNGPISPDDVDVSPLFHISPDSAVIVLTLSTDQAKKLDAGQQIDLGTDSTVIVKQSRVIAALWSAPSSGSSRVAFEIPQSELKAVVDAPGIVAIVDSSKAQTPQNAGNVENGQKRK